MPKEKIRLSNDDLKVLPRCAVPFNDSGGVITNKEILRSICNELLEYRLKAGIEK